MLLIERSGYGLDLTDDERVDDLVVAVAEGSANFATVRAWFQARLVHMDDLAPITPKL